MSNCICDNPKHGYHTSNQYSAKYFNYINITGYHYCVSHNFIFDPNEEKRKLYDGLPCIYTDNRYKLSNKNFYNECYIYYSRNKKVRNHSNKLRTVNRNPKNKCYPISLKSALRRVRKLKSVPKGAIIKFTVDWYYTNKDICTHYIWKNTAKGNFTPSYEVNDPSYNNNFHDDEKCFNLVNVLRENGFLVSVYKDDIGDVAEAYGYGKIIGFSSGNNTFNSYSYGINNILYDLYGEFDKWSRCNQISKDTNIDEIINILKN